ncbi:MAG: hypothetical protein V9E86_01510 [Nitrosomonas sp.]
MSIFVADLLRGCLGLGFFTQCVTLATPTQKRAAPRFLIAKIFSLTHCDAGEWGESIPLAC